MSDVRIGLAIQGPIASFGYAGSSGLDGSWGQSDKINFECTANIVRIFQEQAPLFSSIVCVTWDTEDASELKAAVGADRVLQIRDTTKTWEWDGGFFSTKYKQALSTLAGVRWLKDRDCDVVLKVRTDQYLDFRCVYDELVRLHSTGSLAGRIALPHFTTLSPTDVEDFYFAAETSTLEKACDGFLRLDQFNPQVHKDLFFKWAWILKSAEFGLPLTAYFPSKLPETIDQKKLLHKAWTELYYPLPVEARTSLIWRGAAFVEPIPQTQLVAESSPSEIGKILNERFPVAESSLNTSNRPRQVPATDWPGFVNFAFGSHSKASRATSVGVRAGRWIRNPERARDGIRRRLKALR